MDTAPTTTVILYESFFRAFALAGGGKWDSVLGSKAMQGTANSLVESMRIAGDPIRARVAIGQLHSLYNLFGTTVIGKDKFHSPDGIRVLGELDSKMKSRNPSDQIEGLLFVAVFLREFSDPMLVTSAMLKLGEFFCQVVGMGIRRCSNLEEIVGNFYNVLRSNDPQARALSLRLFGSLVHLVTDRVEIHHACIETLTAPAQDEVMAAFSLATKLSKRSNEFCRRLLPTINRTINSPLVPMTQKAGLISLLSHMHSDPIAYTEALNIIKKYMAEYNVKEFLCSALTTLTQLCVRSGLNITDCIELLEGYVNSEGYEDAIVCTVIDCFKLIAVETGCWTPHVFDCLVHTMSTVIREKCLDTISKLCLDDRLKKVTNTNYLFELPMSKENLSTIYTRLTNSLEMESDESRLWIRLLVRFLCECEDLSSSDKQVMTDQIADSLMKYYDIDTAIQSKDEIIRMAMIGSETKCTEIMRFLAGLLMKGNSTSEIGRVLVTCASRAPRAILPITDYLLESVSACKNSEIAIFSLSALCFSYPLQPDLYLTQFNSELVHTFTNSVICSDISAELLYYIYTITCNVGVVSLGVEIRNYLPCSGWLQSWLDVLGHLGVVASRTVCLGDDISDRLAQISAITTNFEERLLKCKTLLSKISILSHTNFHFLSRYLSVLTNYYYNTSCLVRLLELHVRSENELGTSTVISQYSPSILVPQIEDSILAFGTCHVEFSDLNMYLSDHPLSVYCLSGHVVASRLLSVCVDWWNDSISGNNVKKREIVNILGECREYLDSHSSLSNSRVENGLVNACRKVTEGMIQLVSTTTTISAISISRVVYMLFECGYRLSPFIFKPADPVSVSVVATLKPSTHQFIGECYEGGMYSDIQFHLQGLVVDGRRLRVSSPLKWVVIKCWIHGGHIKEIVGGVHGSAGWGIVGESRLLVHPSPSGLRYSGNGIASLREYWSDISGWKGSCSMTFSAALINGGGEEVAIEQTEFPIFRLVLRES